MHDSADQPAIDVTREGSTVVVVAHGEVDASNSEGLARALVAIGSDATGKELLLDMSGVTFIDSSGLRALLVGQQAAEVAGTSWRVASASDAVRRVFEITGLTSVLRLTSP